MKLSLPAAVTIFLSLVSALAAFGQSAPAVVLPLYSDSVNASGENSRLRQMESIYQQQLRTRHIPLLGKYLSTLQRMAATSTDPRYQDEIERVQSIIGTGGIVDLNAASRSLASPTEMPVPTPIQPPSKGVRAVISLTPSLARLILPVPAGSASPSAAMVGRIEWRIESLPPGRYEILVQYSLPTLAADDSLEVRLGGNAISRKLTPDRMTSRGAFRLMRIGRLQLEQELRGETLSLTAGSEDRPLMLVREIMINRATDP